MRLLKTLVQLTLAVDVAVASSWFSKAAYNKWHETELERWLSDNNVPYPTPADRRDLQKLVESNWNSYVVAPYQNWDADQLTAYLKLKGVETQDTAARGRDALLAQVKDTWYETEDKSQTAWTDVSNWILDTWTESQLKAFCDHHGIPVPQPRTRDTLLTKARQNWDTVVQKSGEAAAYPGDWLYSTWSDSDLKEWLDKNGFPAPQPTTRDKLVASVRRNSRVAYLKLQDQANAAQATAQATQKAATDTVVSVWNEGQWKSWAIAFIVGAATATGVNRLFN